MAADIPDAKIPRSFLLLWTGQAISLLGSALVQFAIVWWENLLRPLLPLPDE